MKNIGFSVLFNNNLNIFLCSCIGNEAHFSKTTVYKELLNC